MFKQSITLRIILCRRQHKFARDLIKRGMKLVNFNVMYTSVVFGYINLIRDKEWLFFAHWKTLDCIHHIKKDTTYFCRKIERQHLIRRHIYCQSIAYCTSCKCYLYSRVILSPIPPTFETLISIHILVIMISMSFLLYLNMNGSVILCLIYTSSGCYCWYHIYVALDIVAV